MPVLRRENTNVNAYFISNNREIYLLSEVFSSFSFTAWYNRKTAVFDCTKFIIDYKCIHPELSCLPQDATVIDRLCFSAIRCC